MRPELISSGNGFASIIFSFQGSANSFASASFFEGHPRAPASALNVISHASQKLTSRERHPHVRLRPGARASPRHENRVARDFTLDHSRQQSDLYFQQASIAHPV